MNDKTPTTDVAPWGTKRSWQVASLTIESSPADRYIDLLKRAVLNYLYQCQPPEQNCVSTIAKPQGHVEALSMIGWNGLTMLELALRDIIDKGIPGDVIETGVYRGGTSLFMSGLLSCLAPNEGRTVFVADSFRGIPPVDKRNYVEDAVHAGAENLLRPSATTAMNQVRDNWYQFGLLDESRVQFVAGWFKESLPTAPIKKLALMRLDGDLFASTWDALVTLYPKLVMNGYVIIDDYGDWVGCRRAVVKYRKFCGENANITRFDGVAHLNQFGKFATWRKTTECQLSSSALHQKLRVPNDKAKSA